MSPSSDTPTAPACPECQRMKREAGIAPNAPLLTDPAPFVPPMCEPVITHHIACVVLGWQRAGGYNPSSGEDALIAAAFALDSETLRFALAGCPGLCEAVEVWRTQGRDALVAIERAA